MERLDRQDCVLDSHISWQKCCNTFNNLHASSHNHVSQGRHAPTSYCFVHGLTSRCTVKSAMTAAQNTVMFICLFHPRVCLMQRVWRNWKRKCLDSTHTDNDLVTTVTHADTLGRYRTVMTGCNKFNLITCRQCGRSVKNQIRETKQICLQFEQGLSFVDNTDQVQTKFQLFKKLFFSYEVIHLHLEQKSTEDSLNN